MVWVTAAAGLLWPLADVCQLATRMTLVAYAASAKHPGRKMSKPGCAARWAILQPVRFLSHWFVLDLSVTAAAHLQAVKLCFVHAQARVR
jgi:hypothetical protein